jgi:hypothetical protein
MYRKFSVWPALAVAFLLGACSDNNPTLVEKNGREPTQPKLATAPVGARWSLYTNQTPTETLSGAEPGWEVGTRFISSKMGKVIGFRFYRASGETGTNTARLWAENGTQLASAPFPSGGAGWQTVYLLPGAAASIAANTYYRVSVNTNSVQVKTGGGYAFNGFLDNGPLHSEGGYYGQPTGSMPTSASASYFFVDVIFEEYVPLPNLYISQIVANGGTNYYGQEVVNISVCNNGDGNAAASTTRLRYAWAPPSGGAWSYAPNADYYTPALASGACLWLQPVRSSSVGLNLYEVWADVNDVVYESNENNYANIVWNRLW